MVDVKNTYTKERAGDFLLKYLKTGNYNVNKKHDRIDQKQKQTCSTALAGSTSCYKYMMFKSS